MRKYSFVNRFIIVIVIINNVLCSHFQTKQWFIYFMDKYWVMGSWDLEITGADPSDIAMYRCGLLDTQTSMFQTYQLVNVEVYGI